MRMMDFSRSNPQEIVDLSEVVKSRATPLQVPTDLNPLMERIGDAKFVLLGEASHGTSEYYTWRAEISRRLIQEKGFNFIAVEGDWPDCYQVNRYIKGCADSGSNAHEVLQAFDRWPTWMWANQEIVEFAEWLRRYNDEWGDEVGKVGFYGLDVYSLWDSMREVLGYLERVDPESVVTAKEAYRCFDPYLNDEQQYAAATRIISESCEDEVVNALMELRRKAPQYKEESREAYFDAEQNALVAKNAELYYRTMVMGGPDSWNIRDTHMVETLERLMDHHGPEAKAIVWEHNTHIGDARATDMARGGMVNVGQLVRERQGQHGVVLVGFGSHRGSVIAGDSWGAPMERMVVPPAREGSWEDVFYHAGGENKLMLLNGDQDDPQALRPRGHRAIGVVYDPAYESFGNYVPTVLPRRYDAFLYIDETEALHPLHLKESDEPEFPETFPSGV